MAPLPKQSITADDVIDLFEGVGAPRPSPESLQYIVITFRNIALHYRPKSEPKRTPEQRAQAAVDELRRVLPSIIKKAEKDLGEAKSLYEAQQAHATSTKDTVAAVLASVLLVRVENCERELCCRREMFNNLCDLYLPPRQQSKRVLHEDMQTLLDVYRSVIGREVGISKTGPAVRFIMAALAKCGAAKVEGSAVAQALARGSPKR